MDQIVDLPLNMQTHRLVLLLALGRYASSYIEHQLTQKLISGRSPESNWEVLSPKQDIFITPYSA